MRLTPLLVALAFAGGFAANGALAKAPTDATGECKDGTYTKADKKEGACSSHGGVKDWYDKKAAAAPKPADATGQCKDGTYTTAATKAGACSGHKGVKDWYAPEAKAEPKAKADAKPSKTAAKPAPAPEPSAPATPPKKSTDATATSTDRAAKTQPKAEPAKTADSKTAAPGGGAGKVWVNTDSKVYHCEKDALYGKTKQGEYMTEAAAKSSGARPARGKECA